MALFAREFEAGALIDATGGGQLALGPEHQLLVSGVAGEANALCNQTTSNAKATSRGLNQQQAQLGNRW